MINKKRILRHKDCSGFILPDVEKSFDCMIKYKCSKCGKEIESCTNEIVENIEDIPVYELQNSEGKFLLMNNDAIAFETKAQATEFAEKFNIEHFEISTLEDSTGIVLTNGMSI